MCLSCLASVVSVASKCCRRTLALAQSPTLLNGRRFRRHIGITRTPRRTNGVSRPARLIGASTTMPAAYWSHGLCQVDNRVRFWPSASVCDRSTAPRTWRSFPVSMHVSITASRTAAPRAEGSATIISEPVSRSGCLSSKLRSFGDQLMPRSSGGRTNRPSHCASHPAAAKSRYENLVRAASCFIVGMLLIGRAFRARSEPSTNASRSAGA